MNLKKINQIPGDTDRMERDLVEAHIVAMLEHYKRVNEGANSVIGLINFSELDDRLLDYFFKDKGVEKPINEKFAIKMLKIYSDANLAKNEGEMQSSAREILINGQIEGVVVPRVYFSDSIPVVSETLRNHLEAEGVSTDNNEIGVVLMDFVDGDDMLTHLYKEAIKKYQVANPEENKKLLAFSPELAEVDEHLKPGDSVNFNKLYDRVSLALDLKMGTDSLTRYHARLDNTEKIVKFLSDNGFVMDASVIESLEKSTKLLHKNGFYHRDLHERNIMLSFDDEGKVNKISLIDFGYSIMTSPNNDDVYQEGDKKFPNDDYVAWSYKKLIKPKEVFEEDAFFSKIEKVFSNIKGGEKNLSHYNKLMKNVAKLVKKAEDQVSLMDDLDDLVKDFASDFIKEYVATEDNFNLQLATWRDIVKNYPGLKNDIVEKMSSLLLNKRPLSTYMHNTLTTFINYLKK